jgi:phosphoribosylformylglycinamidine cyclo-ligase
LGNIRALVHITGGGFHDNIVRVLPADCAAVINKNSWTPLPIFRLIQRLGQVPEDEMYHVFNMGIGMVIIIDPKNLKYFRSLKPKIIGEIVKGKPSVTVR